MPGACVFDAYGTLFDYASAAARCSEELGDKREALSRLWREKRMCCKLQNGQSQGSQGSRQDSEIRR
jgi:hypothetical protein